MVHNLTGGGAERVAALWANGFVEHGYEVAIMLDCSSKTPVTYRIPNTVKLYNMYNWLTAKIHRHLGIDSCRKAILRNAISEFKPNVIIGVLGDNAQLAATVVKDWANKPIIVQTEHNSYERPSCSPMSKSLQHRKFVINKQFPCVTVLTQADKVFIGDNMDNVVVMPNPLAYTPVQSIPKKEKVILAAGRLNAWHCKGFDLLIKAWGRIAQKHQDWILQIAGDGNTTSLEFLQSIANEFHVGEQVEFIGYQSDMLPIYRRSSIFVLSSRYEGFGMVLIEAMSQGCAPVACDYKGRQSEIITNVKEGLICPVDDVGALSNALNKMITDDNYRRNTQHFAIERSKNYSLDKIMDKWKEVFNILNL